MTRLVDLSCDDVAEVTDKSAECNVYETDHSHDQINYWALYDDEVPVLVPMDTYFIRARRNENINFIKRTEGLGFSVCTILRREDERHLFGGEQLQFVTDVQIGTFPLCALDGIDVGSDKRSGKLSEALQQHDRRVKVLEYLYRRRNRHTFLC